MLSKPKGALGNFQGFWSCLSLKPFSFYVLWKNKRIESSKHNNPKIRPTKFACLFVKKAFENNITNPHDYEKRTVVMRVCSAKPLTNKTEHNTYTQKKKYLYHIVLLFCANSAIWRRKITENKVESY